MTTKNKDSLIGFDPLAWINDDDKPPDQEETLVEQAVDNASVDKPENEVLIAEVSNQISEVSEFIDNSKILLENTLNISTVAELHSQLVQALQGNECLEIDAANVNSIDTASLQLFVVLKQEALKLNKDIIFDFPSDKFIEAAKLLGIDNMLGVDQAAAGFF
ncbi:STAS domain-containing protein [methanotrophic endosymbiont of Bathymodiolus puteoserpentis (Logatchev)]|jgi:ABC-type transporter Mla MlaB component|uniref:STAS domain-containing protein n=1 Tax=methanotrophic endosymbiont of Bathymodiolus puteoserpentis (Logatchev) TaxID=343235 RepID=UPI0013C5EA43|nr:STAS domain-containing protein [methanotrophic endosymbiont of Bathymodiolus puteoserpentis (Logatchev)]SHE23477.1 hypothetical protein BPUTEOMOX_413 [methanotrophic endosymbiont of Bathymodiolus puteoserpentis (Logatchev)]